MNQFTRSQTPYPPFKMATSPAQLPRQDPTFPQKAQYDRLTQDHHLHHRRYRHHPRYRRYRRFPPSYRPLDSAR